jgi:hypothetical protein
MKVRTVYSGDRGSDVIVELMRRRRRELLNSCVQRPDTEPTLERQPSKFVFRRRCIAGFHCDGCATETLCCGWQINRRLLPISPRRHPDPIISIETGSQKSRAGICSIFPL